MYAWGSTSKNISKLQMVQNWCVPITTSSRKYDHTQPILKELGWLPVESIVKVKDATVMFKCANRQVLKYLRATIIWINRPIHMIIIRDLNVFIRFKEMVFKRS